MIRWLAVLLTAAFGCQAHSLYDDWQVPYTGGSCCSDHDCHATVAWKDEDGNWVARHLGRDVKIPWRTVMAGPSPDGRSHICINIAWTVLCFNPGEVRS